MKTTIYEIQDKYPDVKQSETRLVRATNKAQALRFLAASMFAIRVSNQESLARLIIDGVKIEDATVEPAATATADPQPAVEAIHAGGVPTPAWANRARTA